MAPQYAVPQVRLPFMAAPSMTGAVRRGQWAGADEMVGFCANTPPPTLAPHTAKFWVGGSRRDLFVAVVSGTPPGGKLLARANPMPTGTNAATSLDDAVEIFVDPSPRAANGEIYQAIINAKGLDNGVTFFAAGSASVSGFKVTGALGEGILAVAAQKITIKHNVVVHNDNGGASSGWFECSPQGHVPGDCGEGIHLLSSHDSLIAGNRSMFNSGGILLTDEFGPNFDNTISGNLVEDNLYDCGVTVVSHNPAALSSKGVPQPTKGGTFDNTISGNMIISNGTLGEGAGIVFASAVAGGAAYNNKVTGNEIVGNGLSGVTIHQHAPLTDVSGNVITGNWIGTNNLTGDPGTGDSLTTGVLVDNGGTHKVIDVTVKKNTIAWNTYGIYNHSGGGLTQSGNIFLHVAVHVKK